MWQGGRGCKPRGGDPRYSVAVKLVRAWVAGGMVGAWAAWAPLAVAQTRERPVEAPVAAALQPRCTLRARPLMPQQGGASPDPRIAPAAVATSSGMLVAWRATEGGLFLARLGPAFERLAEDRELAAPAGPFAMVTSAGGATVVMVERSTRGGEAVLLARLSPTGEARNVPREVGAAEAIDGVSLAWTGTGYVVAWGARGANAGTFVVTTDARGVPRGPARRVLDATMPRVAWLPAAEVAVVAATGATGDPTVAALDEAGAVTDSSRWPAHARALVAAPTGASVMGLGATPDSASGMLSLVRWGLAASAVEGSAGLRVAPGAAVVGAVPDRAGMVVAVDEPAGREWIARVATDGTVSVLAVRPGSLGAIVPGSDAGFTVIGHEPPPAGQGRLAVVSVVCPRPVPVVSAPVVSTAAQAAGGPPASAAAPAADAARVEDAGL
jgi:hypothetical protein